MNNKAVLYFLPLMLFVFLSATLQDCNSGQTANNTTGGCGGYSQGTGFVYVKAPPPSTLQVYTNNYTFSHQYCVPFYLVAGKYIPWTAAMGNGWKLWVSVIDENQNCQQETRFIFQDKFCGNPVYITELVGSTVSYPGYYTAYDELLYIPVATNKPLRFTVSAITNCNECICFNCGTHTYVGDNAWKFTTQVSYDAAEVSVIVSSNYPNFTAGQLYAVNPIYFNCNNSNVAALQCP
ncbi:MAG: hypothetical protein KIS94_12320 [Chitinophagales bacterium]|nr:hypothetical protein [Chitinophagales bacterium]